MYPTHRHPWAATRNWAPGPQDTQYFVLILHRGLRGLWRGHTVLPFMVRGVVIRCLGSPPPLKNRKRRKDVHEEVLGIVVGSGGFGQTWQKDSFPFRTRAALALPCLLPFAALLRVEICARDGPGTLYCFIHSAPATAWPPFCAPSPTIERKRISASPSTQVPTSLVGTVRRGPTRGAEGFTHAHA